jgi:hypothetical protein
MIASTAAYVLLLEQARKPEAYIGALLMTCGSSTSSLLLVIRQPQGKKDL